MDKPKVIVIGALASSLVNFRAPLLDALVAYGAEVHAGAAGLSEDQATLDKLKKMGVTPHDIPFDRAGMNPVRDLKALFATRKLMARLKPDAVIFYTIKPVVFGTLGAWLARVPQRIAMITGLGFAFTEGNSQKRRMANRIARQLYRLSLDKAQTVLFQNPDDRDLFGKLGLTNRRSKIGIVNGSGVDMEHFKEAPLPNGPMTFLMIARLLGDKGVREYAAAAKIIRTKYPDVEVHLAGGIDPNPDSISKAEVDTWVNEGAVIWHDHVEDVRPLIANCHVYVLPSYREGTPRTVLEAMSMRRAIITTDVPGCRETVVDGVNGFLVEARSAEALVKAMETFIVSTALVEEMAAKGLQIAKKKYEKGIVAESVVRTVRRLQLPDIGTGEPFQTNGRPFK